MVNIGIPKDYTASPSSFSGTPHLTINRDVAEDLDSANAFEGPEKLLEVWFSPSSNELPVSAAPSGLKAVSAETWKDMLDLVNCQVLSIVESEQVDAYLLSESSMFVFPHKLILKTCGTTTLLSGLPRILEIAALFAGFPHVRGNPLQGTATAATPYRVFYSRKNFLFPNLQRGPHRSWRDEVKSLDKLFLGGSAYMIGKMNGEHWYLYLTAPNTVLTPPATPKGHETETQVLEFPRGVAAATMNGLKAEDGQDDETLEVLMTDLDEENAKQFYLENASALAEGRYFQRARGSHPNGQHGNGVLGECAFEDMHINRNGLRNRNEFDGQDGFDVFSNTSDDSEFNSDGEDIIPEELTTEGHALGTVVSESCGLADVYPSAKYPDARIDAYLFTPCGFSANGVIPPSEGTKGSHYFNVHVTPEPHCSYASFETNVPGRQTGRETAEVVEQVVNIFKPGRFSVTLFEARPDAAAEMGFLDGNGNPDALAEIKSLERQAARRSARMENFKGYRRVDRIVHDLDGYDLVFRYYERFDWKGGAPRLGEAGF